MRRGRVLVVDDEENIRKVLKEILEDEGFEVELAESGEEATTMVERRMFDLIFLDIWLPGIDGLEVLKRIRESEFPPYVVMISGHGNIQTAVEATKLGAYDFIEKPLSMEKIILTAKNAVREKKLHDENKLLRGSQEEQVVLVGESRALQRVRELIEEVAPTDGTVLITGENGTGKELVARLIHLKSKRRGGNFVPINCAAIPDELMESELFGYVKGAFTNAFKNKKGKLQIADGGTLFLDEIGDMSLKTQAKILRVLEEQRFEALGSTDPVEIDTRIISATNKDLQKEIGRGNFREDLYYRINVIPIYIPPLRERKEDIIPIAQHYLEFFGRKYGKPGLRFSDSAKRALLSYPWHGNVRELKNAIERVVILKRNQVIEAEDFHLQPGREEENLFIAYQSLQEAKEAFEKKFIERKLRENNWNIKRTAEVLGIDRSYLHRKMKQYGIEKENGYGEG